MCYHNLIAECHFWPSPVKLVLMNCGGGVELFDVLPKEILRFFGNSIPSSRNLVIDKKLFLQVIFRACTAVTVTRGSFWLILAAGVEGALAASCNHISRDPHQVLAPAPSTFRNCNMGAVEACNNPKPSPQSATIHNRKSFNNHRHHKVRAKSLSGPVSITTLFNWVDITAYQN